MSTESDISKQYLKQPDSLRKIMNKKLHIIFYICVLVLLCQSTAAAQSSPNEITPNDINRVTNVSDAQISPNGLQIVYTVSIIEGNASKTSLWIVSNTALDAGMKPSGGAPLLPVDWNGSRPRWSPDGKWIAFRSAHNGQSGIWIVPSEGQVAPRFVTAVHETNYHLPYTGESFAWSPDSRRIAFIDAGQEPNDALPAASKEDDPRIIDRIQYKSRTSFSDRLRTHLWIVDVAPGSTSASRQLTSGKYYDHAITWNPQGNEIAFLSNHEPDPETNNNSDIFAVDLNGRTRQITRTRGCEYQPTWSPDGRLIAYTATKREITTIDSVAEDAHLWVIDAQGTGAGRELTAAQDRRARNPQWQQDSRSILYMTSDYGRTGVYRVNTNGGPIQTITFARTGSSASEGETQVKFENEKRDSPGSKTTSRLLDGSQIGGFSIAYLKSVAASQSDPADSFNLSMALTIGDDLSPNEVWGISGNTKNAVSANASARRLSSHNDTWLKSLVLVKPEEFSFKSFDGTIIQGWLIKPANFRAGEKYPLILSIHGGPHGMFGYSFNPSFQVYAACGYAVLYLNPRGSSGYGQKFSDGTLRNWGGGDYQDLMLGVDEAIRKNSWVDKNRLGVTGGSYGGFMTNWIITQTPRFKAAVASASVSNLISFYATSLYQDLVHAEFGGLPADNYDLLWRWSPIRYINKAQTPTLFIHGELDNDVHITQAEEMYMGLRRHGVESLMVRYPREGHGLGEPVHRVDALERTIGWFDRFLK